MRKEEAYKKIVMILSRAWQREQNMRYQRFRLAWAHFKAKAEVRVYLRQPANRLWNRQREQQRKQRKKPTRVHFEGALCADIRVLINVAPWSRYQSPSAPSEWTRPRAT